MTEVNTNTTAPAETTTTTTTETAPANTTAPAETNTTATATDTSGTTSTQPLCPDLVSLLTQLRVDSNNFVNNANAAQAITNQAYVSFLQAITTSKPLVLQANVANAAQQSFSESGETGGPLTPCNIFASQFPAVVELIPSMVPSSVADAITAIS